ncbi:unnamed protein product [Ilex paraguariensis]
MLSGEIPSSLGRCISLRALYIDGNSFQGTIPPSLSSLRSVEVLDFSRNNLTGQIPEYLENLIFLQNLNLSFNDFEGEVPLGGVFQNATAVSVVGNSELCGGVPELQLPKCSIKEASKKHGISFAVKLAAPISSGILVLILVLFSVFIYKWRQRKFSSVYKGILDETETVVAVKVLTSCSSIDFQGNDFKALVYAYMDNGSLDSWLHENPMLGTENEKPRRRLNLLQRLNIAIDVACALDYLHYHCGTPLVHCDLKPSNVLLDSDLLAHVGDFGLAKFLAEATPTFSSNQANSIGIIGTIGYVVPEYVKGSRVSTYGDVYSYGILMLEIFIGKRTTNDMFNDGLNLHNFAKMAIPERVIEISDLAIFCNEDEEIIKSFHTAKHEQIKECLISIFKVGIACSMELPSDRMSIGDAITELHLIKVDLLRHRIQQQEGANVH